MARAQKEDHSEYRLILDSGAIIALARGDRRALAFLALSLELRSPIEIPVVIVAETVRGGDAPINRLLKAPGSVPTAHEIHGLTAGRLLAATRSAHTWKRLAAQHPEVVIHSL
ncbi:MAG TPA: hypothetical protein VGS07_34420 [Thermoanaerobaculia bacterium]|jgi:hypothetical protein|nr:hypothetical protein [Thermoanaerobaculia bacterium]